MKINAAVIHGIKTTFIMFLITVLLVLCFFIIYLFIKKSNPLKMNSLVLIVEFIVIKIDDFVNKNMNFNFYYFSSYILTLCFFIPLCFIFSIIGLPNPFTFFGVPLSISLCTFILIHFTSIRFTKSRYFQRYLSPFPIFLPVNLLTMWIPLISMSFRLFGNAFTGWILTNMFYGALDKLLFFLGKFSWLSIPFLSFIALLFHLYFDIFSCLIQTIIFIFLSTLFVAQEIKQNNYHDNANSFNNQKKISYNNKEI